MAAGLYAPQGLELVLERTGPTTREARSFAGKYYQARKATKVGYALCKKETVRLYHY